MLAVVKYPEIVEVFVVWVNIGSRAAAGRNSGLQVRRKAVQTTFYFAPQLILKSRSHLLIKLIKQFRENDLYHGSLGNFWGFMRKSDCTGDSVIYTWYNYNDPYIYVRSSFVESEKILSPACNALKLPGNQVVLPVCHRTEDSILHIRTEYFWLLCMTMRNSLNLFLKKQKLS